MRDATRHLTERTQPLLLHDHLLRVAQLVVGIAQREVQLRLIARERDIFTELIEELVVAAAETVGIQARDQQHTEDSAALLDEQWNCDEGTQAATPETPREGKIGGGDVAFVDQLTTNTTAQSIVVDLDFRLFAEADLGRALRAVRADARHGQLALDRVILAQAREVDVQVILEITYYHQ